MVGALDVAQYLVRLATPSEDEDADCLCHMRLQKLLYYIQGWHLAAVGSPLFGERIEAWRLGPVVKPLYPVFKDYRLAIPASQGRESVELSDRDKDFIRSVWSIYEGYSATALSNMTHRESPWVDARGGLAPTAHSDEEITHKAMRDFFFPRYVELLRRKDSRIDPTVWRASASAVAAGQVQSAGDIRRDLHNRRARANPS